MGHPVAHLVTVAAWHVQEPVEPLAVMLPQGLLELWGLNQSAVPTMAEVRLPKPACTTDRPPLSGPFGLLVHDCLLRHTRTGRSRRT